MSISSTTTSANSTNTSQISKNNVAVAAEDIRHSVCRSNELLSCAKTAWKIQQQQQQQHDPSAPPLPIPNLELATNLQAPLSLTILEEGLTLLRAMEYGAQQLQKLVRRRGHTNDPTAEISKLVQQLEQDTQELTEFCTSLLQKYQRRRKQERKHWELVVQWFQQVAGKYSQQLQECLKLRGEVLAEQAQQRRKLVDKKKKNAVASTATKANATPLFDSPLFQPPQKKVPKGAPPAPLANGTQRNRPTGGYGGASNGYSPYGGASNSASAGYGGGGGYGGYGGGADYASTGMRQRKSTAAPSSNYNNYQQEEEEKVHYQIQQRQQQRQTQQRLDEARQAETALGELGQLFGKMSSLIVQQGETLEKIEDDVEAAHADVMAGQEEITKLYAIKKGNRPLIIKTFAILIFLIIFMKGYKN